MSNPSSQIFQETAKDIEDTIKLGFKGRKDYLGSKVLKLTQRLARTKVSRSDGVDAVVENIFEPNAVVTEKDVEKGIEKGIEEAATNCPPSGCVLTDAIIEVKDLCNVGQNPCDTKTSRCSSEKGEFKCDCVEGYIKTDLSDRLCVACSSGEQAVSQEKCEPCSFGFSGFNCEEPWKLVLVIVGSVLGGLLLIMIIVLIVTKSKTSKKGSKKEPVGNGFTADSTKAPLANNTSSLPKFPRASALNSGWSRNTNLEMTESTSRQNLVSRGGNPRTYEDLDDMGGARNPYAKSQASNNPYSRNGGQANPNFMQRY